MRKKTVTKLLSLSLAFALAFTSAIPGNLVLAAAQPAAETAVEAEALSDNSAVEQEAAETAEQDDEMLQEDASADAEDDGTEGVLMQSEDADAMEESAEDENASADTEEADTEADQDDLMPEKLEADPTELVSKYIKDANLRDILLSAYNYYSKESDISADAFTFAKLNTMHAIDFSNTNYAPAATAKKVTDITGLGYFTSAEYINLIGTGVTVLPKAEFAGNTKLKAIVLPDSLTSLGMGTFNGCTALEIVTTELNSAEYEAEFDWTDTLASGQLNMVNAADSAHSFGMIQVLYEQNGTKKIDRISVGKNRLPKSLNSDDMKSSVFAGCTALKDMTIDLTNGAAFQGADSMFSGCEKLSTVTIGESITAIPASCFAQAGKAYSGLTISFTSAAPKLNTIMDSAFAGANIATLDLSSCSQLKQIGDKAFSGIDVRQTTEKEKATTYLAQGISTLILPATVTGSVLIGKEAFIGSTIKVIRTPSQSDEVGVYLPDYVSSIGEACFYHAQSVEKVRMPAQLTTIPRFAFAECSKLEEVTVADGSKIKTVDEAAFMKTTKLKDADFLGNCKELQSIGKVFASASEEETYLGKLDMSYSYPKKDEEFYKKFNEPVYYYTPAKIVMGSYVFGESGITSVKLPDSLTKIGAAAFILTKNLSSVKWGETVSAAKAGDTVEIQPFAFLEAGTWILQNRDPLTDTNGDLLPQPAAVNEETSTLLSFEYPAFADGVKLTIGQFAFAASSVNVIRTVKIGKENCLPSCMKSLGEGAFAYCVALKKINITNTKTDGQWVAPTLGNTAFFNDLSLEEINLPSKLTAIPYQFLAICGLKKMPGYIVSDSPSDKLTGDNTTLQTIGERAFFVALGWENGVVDLSNLTGLTTIGPLAFSYYDDKDEKDKDNKNGVYASYGWNTKSVKLPADVRAHTATMSIGRDPFNCSWLSSMTAGNTTVAGNVYIPTYIREDSVQKGLFANTDVQTATWGCVKVNGKYNVNQLVDGSVQVTDAMKWHRIPVGMFLNAKCTDFSQCSLPAEDLYEIGENAYAGLSALKELDLSGYTLLEKIGKYAFCNGLGIERIIFPDSGKLTRIEEATFLVGANDVADFTSSGGAIYASKLSSIHFGCVKEIGKWAFANKDRVKKSTENQVTSQLTELDFSASKITLIEDAAFMGHENLKKLLFVNGTASAPIKTMGIQAFAESTALIGDTAKNALILPEALVSLGNQVFEKCYSLTEVQFNKGLQTIGAKTFLQDQKLKRLVFGAGSKVNTIGEQAFAECYSPGEEKDSIDTTAGGLQFVDFNNLTELTTMGSRAFYRTCMAEVDLSKTQVKELNEAFRECLNLKKVTLNSSMEWVGTDSFAGCINLKIFGVSPMTAMSKDTFKSNTGFKLLNGTAIATKYTPIDGDDFVFDVRVEEPIRLGKGEVEDFPYYISEYDAAKDEKTFPHLIVGSTDKGSLADAYKYIKVKAKIANQNYFYQETKVKVADVAGSNLANYYEDTDNKIVTINKKKFQTFQIEALDFTPGNVAIPLTARFNLRFSCNGNEIQKPVSATYQLYIVPVYKNVYTALYEDKARTQAVAGLNTNQETGVSNMAVELRATQQNKGKVTRIFYYDLKRIKKSNYDPEDCNLILETSDPDVVAVGGTNAKAVDGRKDLFKVTNAPKAGTTINVNSLTSGKTISLTAKGTGAATVTVYPELFPECKTVLQVTVKADISGIDLKIPNGNATANPGDVFNIVNSISVYFGNSITAKKENFKDLGLYTDNKVSFTSSDPSVATIDEYGFVTIKAVTFAGKKIILTAKTTGTGGSVIEKKLEYTVKYPETKSNTSIKTATGETIKVTVPSKQGGTGTAIFMMPANGATDVVIPASYQRNGYTFKVTSIDPKAFAGNKTLKTVSIGSNVAALPDGAFKDCTALTKVVIPKSVKTIGNNVFNGCKKLKTVTFKSGSKLTAIGNSAFAGCKALTSIKIPAKVKTIGTQAFYKCSKLKTITFQGTKLKTVGDNAFKGIYKKAKIKVPKKKLSAYKKILKGKGQGKKVKITK